MSEDDFIAEAEVMMSVRDLIQIVFSCLTIALCTWVNFIVPQETATQESGAAVWDLSAPHLHCDRADEEWYVTYQACIGPT